MNEQGETVPLGTNGEICFRGYMLMKGYYKNEAKTKEVMNKDGWFSTG